MFFAGLVCNNAQIVAGQLLGQPTEGALLVAALKVSFLHRIQKKKKNNKTQSKSIKPKICNLKKKRVACVLLKNPGFIAKYTYDIIVRRDKNEILFFFFFFFFFCVIRNLINI